jgi:fructokinase
MKKVRFGIDLGGTKTEIIALDEGGAEVLRERTATPKNDAAAICLNIANMVRAAETKLSLSGPVGIATPGAIDPSTNLLRNSNTVCLNGFPVKAEIEKQLGREIKIANDANCFALSEASDGAAAGAPVVFGVIVGTGCGGGVVVHGKVIDGKNGIAGEWGHSPLSDLRDDERPGVHCYCGRWSCVETWLSGTFLSKQFALRTGRDVPAAQIAALAESGDAQCADEMARYEDRMARALGVVINILDPDVIVLGGGVSNIARLYTNVPKLLPKYAITTELHTQFVKAKFGDSSGVRGAAWLNPL